ncbi:hypothetical protein DdX_21742 [Ditylenchus destructor]|uniref:Uncharacterized protein n=1 Tax=Ditylenchus destructor TaxID=166010 RepID=A0AAD4MEG6_9BILA|nr:hypothetical protein DdX_21742 [Ditylenchus destructor]
MKEQWQRYRRKINKAAKFGNEIDKEGQEPTNSQSLQSPPRLVPTMAPAVLKRQNQEAGSNDDPAKRSRIDTQKKPEESGAMNTTNVWGLQSFGSASGSNY